MVVTPYFFDVLHLDGVDLLDSPAAARAEVLERLVPSAHRVPRVVTSSTDETAELDVPEQLWDDGVVPRQPGRLVREKQHSAEPMTIDDALYQMDLVGHDFYLFNDSETGKPSVVYRRKGFDYGVIRLG